MLAYNNDAAAAACRVAFGHDNDEAILWSVSRACVNVAPEDSQYVVNINDHDITVVETLHLARTNSNVLAAYIGNAEIVDCVPAQSTNDDNEA